MSGRQGASHSGRWGDTKSLRPPGNKNKAKRINFFIKSLRPPRVLETDVNKRKRARE